MHARDMGTEKHAFRLQPAVRRKTRQPSEGILGSHSWSVKKLSDLITYMDQAEPPGERK